MAQVCRLTGRISHDSIRTEKSFQIEICVPTKFFKKEAFSEFNAKSLKASVSI